MSPARLTLSDHPALEGLWSTMGSKLQNQPQQQRPVAEDDLDLADDIKTLWDSRWKSACKRRQHPFQDASYLDVAPLFASLIEQGVTSAHWPAYTKVFVDHAQTLADDAHAITLTNRKGSNQERRAASQLLLRAVALLRVARYPYSPSHDRCSSSSSSSSTSLAASGSSSGGGKNVVCALKKRAYDLQKTYYRRAVELRDEEAPLDEVLIPHIHADPETTMSGFGGSSSGSRGCMSERRTGAAVVAAARRLQIPLSVRVPLQTLYTGAPCPAAVILTRDRTGCTAACEEVLRKGWASVVVEVPGEGECPVAGAGNEDEDKDEEEAGLWASVLDWMRAVGFYDMDRVVVVGEGAVVLRAVAGVSCGARVKGAVAYLEEEEGEQQRVAARPVLCETLLVRGASSSGSSGSSSSTVPSNGLWTPDEEEDGERDERSVRTMTLSAYRPRSAACVGQLATSDAGRAYAWLEDVVEARAHDLPSPLAIMMPRTPTRSVEKGAAATRRAPPGWFSREASPPESDVEMASACGSSF